MGWSNQIVVANLVIIEGTNDGEFVYNGPAALGDLIASIVPAAGTDPEGNVTVQGVAAYLIAGGRRYAIGLNQSGPGGLPGVTIADTASPPTIPAGFYGESSAAGIAEAAIYSGEVSGADVPAQVIVFSQTASGVANGTGLIQAGLVRLGTANTLVVNDNTGAVQLQKLVSAPAAIASTAQYYANANGIFSTETPAGFAGTIPASQVDAPGTPYSTALGPADLTKTWSVPAGDGKAGTIYTIETHLTIETGTIAETFTIGVDLNSGTRIPLATLGAAFNGSAASTTYDIPVRVRLVVDAVGVSTPLITLGGPLGDTAANRLATNSANMTGSSVGATWNKANANTWAIYGVWGAAGGGPQNAQSYYSEHTRSGN